MINVNKSNRKVQFNGYELNSTIDEVNDYCIQTGHDAYFVTKWLYDNDNVIIRSKKLKLLLNEKTT